MKIFLTSFVLFLSFSSIALGQKMDTVYVYTGEEFEEALLSNTVIIIKSKHIQLSKYETIIEKVENLTITNDSTGLTKLTTEETGNCVLTFRYCKNIKIQNLSIGHWPDEGYCEGDVVDLYYCDSVFIYDCDLFGSGVTGLDVQRSNVWCYNTVIRDCSNNVVNDDYGYSSYFFKDCTFRLHEENEFYFPGPWFENCTFYIKDSLIVERYDGFYPETPMEIQSELLLQFPSWDERMNEEGALEWICPESISLKVSSELTSQKGISYSSDNLRSLPEYYGTGPANAWVEGIKGDGIGEKISISIQSLISESCEGGITGEFIFINGYAKIESIWKANNRIKRLKVSRNGKHIAFIELQDSPNLQHFDLGTLVQQNYLAVGEELVFEIMEVYEGSRYDDTALTFFVPTSTP
ncbi:MAG: hypothetical protein AAFO07_03775 [Bacteroidota bacterium]